MRIEFDDTKRRIALDERRLDFADAAIVFAGANITLRDDRRDYGEPRWQTVGRLRGAVVMVVWTPRGEARRVISMRRCHDKEARGFLRDLDRS